MPKLTMSCRWCGQPVAQVEGRGGRVREFCHSGHRTTYHFWVRRTDTPVTLRELIQREGLRCGICSGPVDLAATGELAPSIDHIVPVARGGSNMIDNLQIAHKRCNSKKCDRLGYECSPIGQAGNSHPQLPGFTS